LAGQGCVETLDLARTHGSVRSAVVRCRVLVFAAQSAASNGGDGEIR
jgi:hypothetical protein